MIRAFPMHGAVHTWRWHRGNAYCPGARRERTQPAKLNFAGHRSVRRRAPELAKGPK